MKLSLLFDRFTIAIIVAVAAASFFPAYGDGAVFFKWLTTAAIALLFFLHGAKLSREAIIAGVMHWRLHIVIFVWTFVIFPLIGWGLYPLLVPLIGEPLAVGVVYMAVLPGTVQSAIAFTSIARGNVPAAVCAASASSIVGIVITPLLLRVILGTDISALDSSTLIDSIQKISLQILVPFVIGHAMRPLIGRWMDSHRSLVSMVDRSSILLVVYTAFSDSVVGGLWKTVSTGALLWVVVVSCFILLIVLGVNMWTTRKLGFNRADEITIVFCGSKKSLATGVPMAGVLFSASAIGPALLPLMIFHQIQLMVCAVMAQRYPRKEESSDQAGALAGSASSR